MVRWYCVHTHPHAEEKAAFNLARQGYGPWLPRYRKKRSHARRVEWVLRPLFPRYLFVALDPEKQAWRPMLSTFGVAGLVMRPDGPSPVPAGVVDELKSRAGADGVFEIKPPGLKPGSGVRITAGPFADLEGVLQTESDAERVMVLLSIMGRSVKVTVPIDDIEAR